MRGVKGAVDGGSRDSRLIVSFLASPPFPSTFDKTSLVAEYGLLFIS
jgi:hypothetical protein